MVQRACRSELAVLSDNECLENPPVFRYLYRVSVSMVMPHRKGVGLSVLSRWHLLEILYII